MDKTKEIRIIVDTNDADYLTSLKKISDEDLQKIMPLIEAIKNFKSYSVKIGNLTWPHHHNWPSEPRIDLGEKTVKELYNLEEEVFEIFEELLPHMDEYGCHTIESIEVCPIISWKKLL